MKLFESALLVEDEPHLASTLQIALNKLKIPQIRHVSTIKEAWSSFKGELPELILLDRTLPDGEGLELCSVLREQEYSGTILVLTASGQVEDRVHGLDCGADDYLAKPFSWEELEARIRALARRRRPFQSIPALQREPSLWDFNSDLLKILGPRGWVTLTPLEFKLATYLISQSGRIVSRDNLLQEVWGFHLLPKTRTVDHFLGRLRKHFEENPEDPRHFLTIRGAGYRFVI